MHSFHASPPSGKSTPDPTLAHLNRWNIQDNKLPNIESIKTIYVYDFDNTLFMSPLPNSKIWHSPTLGNLQQVSWLTNGGWWHDSRILAATGQGIDVEEKRAWEGWWNEHVVSFVQLSMEQKDAMTILLTGRSSSGFSELIKRIVQSKKLGFDMIVLKPDGEGKTTLGVKCAFLQDLLNTYKDLEEIRVYEDRVKHIKAFDEFFNQYVASVASRRTPLKAEVVQVAETARTLDPIVELREVQKMVNEHNDIVHRQMGPTYTPMALKKTVFYTGYLLNSRETTKLLNALEIPKMVSGEPDVKLLGNNVLITPRPASYAILQKVGGLGTKVEFEVTGLGHWDNRVWAALVKPTDPSAKIYTDNPQTIIVLAVRRNAKPIDAKHIQTWMPPSKDHLRFETVVGEKLLLRIEEDLNEGYHPHHRDFNSSTGASTGSGKEAGFRPMPPSSSHQGVERNHHHPRHHRGGGDGGRGARYTRRGGRGVRGGRGLRYRSRDEGMGRGDVEVETMAYMSDLY